MNDKQPLADLTRQSRGDNSPSFEAKQEFHDPTGKVLAIVGFGLACVAIGACLLLPKLMDAKMEKIQATLDLDSNRAQISENHWRNLEVQQASDHAEIEKLKQEIRNARR